MVVNLRPLNQDSRTMFGIVTNRLDRVVGFYNEKIEKEKHYYIYFNFT